MPGNYVGNPAWLLGWQSHKIQTKEDKKIMRSITYYSSFQHNRAKPIPRIPRRGRWLWYGLLGLFAAGFLFGCTLQSKNLFEIIF